MTDKLTAVPEIDDAAEAEFPALDDATAEYHAILKVWRELLRPAEDVRKERVQPAWASRICSTYPQMVFSDMTVYRDLYFDRVDILRDVLVLEIGTDDECLKVSTPEEDVEQNSQHYRNLLRDWQLKILGWEMDWDCEDKDAAADLASLAEVHKMFFSQQGVTAYLDNIGFQYTEADQAELSKELEEYKEYKEYMEYKGARGE